VLCLPGAPRLDAQFRLALELDQTRAMWRQAWPIALGIHMALEEIPLAAFHAIYDDPEEAEAQHALHEARKRVELDQWRWKNMPE